MRFNYCFIYFIYFKSAISCQNVTEMMSSSGLECEACLFYFKGIKGECERI